MRSRRTSPWSTPEPSTRRSAYPSPRTSASPSGEAGLDSVGGGNLSDNGGPTETIALLAGSPAIGAGFVGSCPMRDQRGAMRRTPCDSGAYEAVPEAAAQAAPLAAAGALGFVARRRRCLRWR